jgi:hypothetical protein
MEEDILEFIKRHDRTKQVLQKNKDSTVRKAVQFPCFAHLQSLMTKLNQIGGENGVTTEKTLIGLYKNSVSAEDEVCDIKNGLLKCKWLKMNQRVFDKDVRMLKGVRKTIQSKYELFMRGKKFGARRISSVKTIRDWKKLGKRNHKKKCRFSNIDKMSKRVEDIYKSLQATLTEISYYLADVTNNIL